jgi:hypothetical protein
MLYGREVEWHASNCAGCGRFRLDVDGVPDRRHKHCDESAAGDQPQLFGAR